MHVEKCGGQTSKDNRLMPILDFETWSFMIWGWEKFLCSVDGVHQITERSYTRNWISKETISEGLGMTNVVDDIKNTLVH
jgi:hypothetical protein